MRRGIAITAMVGTVLLVAGCTPKFDGKIKGKTKGDDKVQVKFTICTRDFPTNECADETPREADRRGFENIHHLVAIRAPKGTDVPDSFRTTSLSEFKTRGAGDTSIRYEKSGQYSRELNDLAPTPGDSKWYGFISQPLDGDEARTKYKIVMGLPDDPGSKFLYRPVTGYAGNNGGERKVDCGGDLFGNSKSKTDNAVCASDPTTRRKIRKSKKIKLD